MSRLVLEVKYWLQKKTKKTTSKNYSERNLIIEIAKGKIVSTTWKRNFLNSYSSEKCASKNCRSCPLITENKTILVNTTSLLARINCDSIQKADCLTSNVIYMLECSCCKMQYVGQTTRTLKCRIQEHLYTIKANLKNTCLINHFNSNNDCKSFTVRVLAKLEPVKGDKTTTIKNLIQLENHLIRLFVTAYPFGLNDKIENYGNVSEIKNDYKNKNSPYFTIKIPRRKRGHGQKSKSKKNLNNTQAIASFNSWWSLQLTLNNPLKGFYQFIRSLTNINTICLCNYLLKMDYQGIRLAVQAVCAFLSSRNMATQNLKEKPKFNYLVVPFINKAVESLNLENLMKQSKIRKNLPPELIKSFVNYRITYKNDPPISLSVCNYGKYLNNLDNHKLKRILESPCECSNSTFIYKPVNHIITGNLEIISNSFTREVLSKGAKFRIPTQIDFPETQTAMANVIYKYFNTFANKHGIPMTNLLKPLKIAYAILNHRLKYIQIQQEAINNFDIRYHQISDVIQGLHSKFIIAPADKASNNFVFICKKYYTEVLCRELGISIFNNKVRATGNPVYTNFMIPNDYLFDLHQLLGTKYNLSLDEENRTIPKIFAIPKLHKNPYKFRFISGATKSSNKPLSLHLLQFLLALRDHFYHYTSKKGKDMKINLKWSINNSDGALAMFNRPKTLNQMITADFSTLFTALPHQTIQNSLDTIIDICFKNANKKYLGVNKNPRVFSYDYFNDCSQTKYNFISCHNLKSLTNTIIKENYVRFADFNFRQDVGVAMGNPASPVLADLTLSALEYLYLINPVNRQKAYLCRNVVRYIDDLGSVNNSQFKEIASEIYPVEIPLNFTEPSDTEVNFLDLQIYLNPLCSPSKRITIYDKTRDFNFQVKKYIHIDSNVHTKLGLNVFSSQLIRLGRYCNNISDYRNELNLLIRNTSGNGFSLDDIFNLYFSVFQNHSVLFQKFKIDDKKKAVSFLFRCL
jgi:hypothetical protein